MRLLLLSNSTNHGSGYLEHALDAVTAFLGDSVLFVPYALADYDASTAQPRRVLGARGIAVSGLHEHAHPRAAIEAADAVFVGGGNSFRLLKTLQALELIDPLRARVRDGMPYMGASAGTNVSGPTIRTTNDMPIVEPDSFQARVLVPFQINPHYLDADPTSTHGGETRELRIRQFLEENDLPVLGMREGTWLSIDGSTAVLGGRAVGARAPGPAVRCERGKQPREVRGDVSDLLAARPRFDVAPLGVSHGR